MCIIPYTFNHYFYKKKFKMIILSIQLVSEITIISALFLLIILIEKSVLIYLNQIFKFQFLLML